MRLISDTGNPFFFFFKATKTLRDKNKLNGIVDEYKTDFITRWHGIYDGATEAFKRNTWLC